LAKHSAFCANPGAAPDGNCSVPSRAVEARRLLHYVELPLLEILVLIPLTGREDDRATMGATRLP